MRWELLDRRSFFYHQRRSCLRLRYKRRRYWSGMIARFFIRSVCDQCIYELMVPTPDFFGRVKSRCILAVYVFVFQPFFLDHRNNQFRSLETILFPIWEFVKRPQYNIMLSTPMYTYLNRVYYIFFVVIISDVRQKDYGPKFMTLWIDAQPKYYTCRL